MDRNKIINLLNTVKFLRAKQIKYRIYYFFRNRFFKKDYSKEFSSDARFLVLDNFSFDNKSYLKDKTFNFLNLKKEFSHEIDWNFNVFGKLWTYNLNYFDFLNQANLSKKEGLSLILDYHSKDAILIDGKEPYTISLRGINWIKFLSKHKIKDKVINQSLYNHYQILLHNLEFHILGNHLLENAFSLVFAGYYFKDLKIYKKGFRILKDELDEQTLKDGAHFELSPMYHQIILFRVLDTIQLLEKNNWKEVNSKLSLPFLRKKASKMLSWLLKVTFKNGNIPMVNDSAYGIAPSTEDLLIFAKSLKIEESNCNLSDSGYRKYTNSNYELFVDIGNVGPSYQPGHAHSDTFNFELYYKNQPIIVDTGTSTYEKNEKRFIERSTSSHNTVEVNQQNQTQVWGGFRVAKRAKIVSLHENDCNISATHNGYKSLNILHTRNFEIEKTNILITDSFKENKDLQKIAFLHFHPEVKEISIDQDSIQLKEKGVKIIFFGNITKIEKEIYNFAFGFNSTKEAYKVKVFFKNNLKTEIKL